MLQWVKIIKRGSWIRPLLRPLCPDGLQIMEVTKEWKQCWSTGVMGLWDWEQFWACSQCGHSRGKEVFLTLRVASGDDGLTITLLTCKENSVLVVCLHSLSEWGTKWGPSSPAGSGSVHSQWGQGTVPLTPGWPSSEAAILSLLVLLLACLVSTKMTYPASTQLIHICQVLLWIHGRYWGFNIEHNRVYSLIMEAGHNQLTKELKTKLQIVISAIETHLFCSLVNLRPQRSVWQMCAWWTNGWLEIEWNESVLWMKMLPVHCLGLLSLYFSVSPGSSPFSTLL